MSLTLKDFEHVMTPIEDGWRLKTVATTCHVDVLKMLATWRVQLTALGPVPWPLRGWCFQRPLHEVVLLALAFNADEGDEPLGWIKEVGTERRACAGYYPRIRDGHKTFVFTCPDCG
jgi:hypothetical protein